MIKYSTNVEPLGGDFFLHLEFFCSILKQARSQILCKYIYGKKLKLGCLTAKKN